MHKNELLAKLTYEHCKKLSKTGYGHNTTVSARAYVEHMFSDNNSRFHYHDFSNLEREYLRSGVMKFRYEMTQGLLDEPEEEEVVEAPQPVQGQAVGYVAIDEAPQVQPGQPVIHNAGLAAYAQNLVNADFEGVEIAFAQAIQNEQ